MKKSITSVLVHATILGSCSSVIAGELADSVYYNGNIYTMTETMEQAKNIDNAHTVEVLATQLGKITFVGSEADAQAAGYFNEENVDNIIDLAGKTMLPGFIDPHGHFPSQGSTDLTKVNLNSAPLGSMLAISDYIPALQAKVNMIDKGEWVQGWGYDDTLVSDNRHPSKDDLDQASTDNPIYINHSSGHFGVANSLALELAAETAGTTLSGLCETTGVECDENNLPTGRLIEMGAMALVTGAITYPADYDAAQAATNALARANQIYAAVGVTTADQGAGFASSLNSYQAAVGDGTQKIRLVMHPLAAYMYGGIDMGGYNRALMGWDYSSEYKTATSAPMPGEDITNFDIPGSIYTSGNSIPAPESAENFEDRIWMGGWKVIFDGSNQGLTGWFKTPGYYDAYTQDDDADILVYPAEKVDPISNKKVYVGKSHLNFTEQEINDLVMLYHGQGFSLDVHTNGNMAAEAYVSALERATAAYPEITDLRTTSIHAQTMERQHIERLTGTYAGLKGNMGMTREYSNWDAEGNLDWSAIGELNDVEDFDETAFIAPFKDVSEEDLAELMKAQNFENSYFATHTYYWGKRHRDLFMGPGKAYNISPIGWSIELGQNYTMHSDTGVTPMDSLRSVFAATTRHSYYAGEAIVGSGTDFDAKETYNADKAGTYEMEFWNYDQRINVLQALHGVTKNVAFSRKLENKIGTLQTGLYADFVILDDDPISVYQDEPLNLADIRIATTIVSDEVVYGFLPNSNQYASNLAPGYEQTTGVIVSNIQSNNTNIDDMTLAGDNIMQHFDFSATVTAAQIATLQIEFLGNNEAIENINLTHISADSNIDYIYGKNLDSEGQFWVSEFGLGNGDPLTALDESDILTMDKTYILNFTVQDNGNFDSDDSASTIAESVVLSTVGELPTDNLSVINREAESDEISHGGCTIGNGRSDPTLTLLLFGILLAFAIRRYRTRQQARFITES